MSDIVGRRLSQLKSYLTSNQPSATIPFDPNATSFPTRKQLPQIEGAPKDCAWVWGNDDNIGRLNLLTPARVKAASAEIKTGEMVSLNLPLNVPETPAFNREKFKHTIKPLRKGIAYDDLYELNTQSGTQWDGFRHFAHIPTNTFYNNTKDDDIVGPNANQKCSIHYWGLHGFSGRAVLLDYRGYAKSQGDNYEVASSHPISLSELKACGKSQGFDIRPAAQGGDIKIGDILLVRSGFNEMYNEKTPEEREAISLRPHGGQSDSQQKWVGLEQSEEIIDWLHDCYFAAVGGDAPSFECWPTQKDYHLHEYILALWGMPLGEMLDLEACAKKSHELKRPFFFFCSSPANMPRGVSSHVNATAIF